MVLQMSSTAAAKTRHPINVHGSTYQITDYVGRAPKHGGYFAGNETPANRTFEPSPLIKHEPVENYFANTRRPGRPSSNRQHARSSFNDRNQRPQPDKSVRFEGTCTYCNKRGHKESECYE